ncbi:DUF397 domain-containing protein [Streptoalloteichus hindustanus]|uniref:DUF397 domain-containing protein n=1 Tax=Streptoalloteichus hindustanus TaxID=2017 RepID=UPI002285FBA0|nr:DUF397 domain-containing protein [Streptoalloteichus hindustanus]
MSLQNGARVEVAAAANVAAVRGSKNPTAPALVFAPAAFTAFVNTVKTGRLGLSRPGEKPTAGTRRDGPRRLPSTRDAGHCFQCFWRQGSWPCRGMSGSTLPAWMMSSSRVRSGGTSQRISPTVLVCRQNPDHSGLRPG